MNHTANAWGEPRKFRGLAAVVLFHLIVAWLLVTGTARQGMRHISDSLRAVVIQEVAITPPPPPPARTTKPTPAARTPDFIPPPETTPTAPAAFAVETPAPAPRVNAPPTPAPTPPAPVATTEAPTATPAKMDMAVVCPRQVAPEMPRKALIDGIQGSVKVQVLIADGQVREVTQLSGPRIFYPAVRSAMLQYQCSRQAGEVLAVQEFNFRIQ